MNKIELLDHSSYITSSSYRNKIIDALYGEEIYKTPTQISKETDIRITHVSNILVDLKKHKYICCINEHRRKNRLYCLTDYGKYICDFMNQKK